MYKSRFRGSRTLISAIDVCKESVFEYLEDRDHYVQRHPMSSPFHDRKLQTFLWEQFFPVACDLHGLTYILDLRCNEPSRVDSIQQEYFEDVYAAGQHSLISFPLKNTAGGMRSIYFHRQNCWRIAALLYFNIAIRTWEPNTWLQKTMVDQLTSSLRQTDLALAWSPFSEVLLWVLAIGSCGAWHPLERGWLLLELKTLVEKLHLKSFGDFEATLKPLLYRERTLHGPMSNIWDEISS